MSVEGVLNDILDLTDASVRAALGTTLQELTGDWLIEQTEYLAGKGPMPPTQVLGQAAFDVGDIVGLQYNSSKNVGGALGLVAFADRLASGRSYLEVFNGPAGALQQSLP